MAPVHKCLAMFSYYRRFPELPWGELPAAWHDSPAGLSTKRALRGHCNPRPPRTSTGDRVPAALSLPFKSGRNRVMFFRYEDNGICRSSTSQAFHSLRLPFSRKTAGVPSLIGGPFLLAKCTMATWEPAGAVSSWPPSPSPAQGEELAATLKCSATASADTPAIMHQRVTTEQKLLDRMTALKTHLLAANWQDYLSFVLNAAFWESEMRLLELEARPFKYGSVRVQGLLRELRRLFDLMAQASDVRDHINQILELGSRATGLAGTGLNASDKLENFEDHVRAAVAEYDRLLKEYPEYCSLVDDCLGSGLAMMRQKQRFTFSALHRFFY